MSDQTDSIGDHTADSDEPLQLRNAQRRIRDAYFANDAGLFVLNCNPGVGKSVTVVDVAAEELLRRFVDGNSTPEQNICVVSFARDDAVAFVPKIVARLRELVKHDLTPAAVAVSKDEVEYLVERVRRAPYVGTIDSVFRGLLGEFVKEVGFERMPAVGTDAELNRLHADCFETVTSANATAIDIVERAYPPDEYDDGPAALLRQAHHQCRARRLTTEEFRAELHTTVDAVYAEGETTSMDDVADALSRCIGADEAANVCSELDDADRDALVNADQRLHEAWRETVDEFCTLLSAYHEEYATRARERGVISHTDCAFLVAEFLNGNLGDGDTAEAKRERVLARYRKRIESVLIDEAQDVSELQHAALAPLITSDCRVLTAGDIRQSIYGFRDALPSIFERAADEGRYFDIDWDTHVTETAATTYRCTPDVAAAINAIAEPALTDPERGNLGDLDVTFPALEAVRESTVEPNVHVAAFDTDASPGSPGYVAPDTGKGEAGILATYISNGLADGTLDDADTDSDENDGGGSDDGATQPDVTVLFRWRTQMARYADAFEAEGLSVENASDYLFGCPVVTTVLDVVEWLVDPADPDRLQALVTESSLGLAALTDAFATHDWDLDTTRERASTSNEVTDEQHDVLSRLHRLREKRPVFHAQSARNCLADIIEILGLRADPNDTFPEVSAAQRVANLDELVHLVSEWERDSLADLADVVEEFAPLQEDPHTGPTQPLADSNDHDVEFKTVHQAKGSEADVVALADLGWSLRKLGPTSQRLVANGPMIGLAPPVHAAAPDIDPLSVFTRGLYDPSDADDRFATTPFLGDVGLRWASERWSNQGTDGQPNADIVGHDRVQTATRRIRAEAFRILLVALSRARNHLVVPLPRDVPGPARPRDRWLETIRDGLEFDGTPAAGTYSLDVDTPGGDDGSIEVAVNDVEPFAADTQHQTANSNTPFAATTPLNRDNLSPLVPRILRPSTLHPLSEDLDNHLLDHLQGRALHTDTDTVDDDLPLILDAFDTEAVGKFIHGVLAAVVLDGVSTTALRTVDEEVERIIDDQLHHHGPPATDAERDGLLTFLTEHVIPDVIESDLWRQLKHAEDVYVEKRLRSHVRREDVEFELEGQADFVMRNPDGSWTITDMKTSLTDTNIDTQQRYRVQVACYAWLLATETDADEPADITTTVETFGAVTDRTAETPSSSMVLERLDEFLNGGQ